MNTDELEKAVQPSYRRSRTALQRVSGLTESTSEATLPRHEVERRQAELIKRMNEIKSQKPAEMRPVSNSNISTLSPK